jgi:hypothetical protein
VAEACKLEAWARCDQCRVRGIVVATVICICTDLAGVMVAVCMMSCNATDEDFPSACMQTGMLPMSMAWILLSQRMMSVGKREEILRGTHMFQHGSESIIWSDQSLDLDVIFATRACATC